MLSRALVLADQARAEAQGRCEARLFHPCAAFFTTFAARLEWCAGSIFRGFFVFTKFRRPEC